MKYVPVALFVAAAFGASVSNAQAQSSPDAVAYEYRSIEARYDVQPDSSIKVEERITVRYVGTFHSLWRGISLGQVAVRDVEVIDADTGQSLVRVARFPDLPNDQSNWGTYAWVNDRGYFKVEWYYNAADTQKTWILRYTLRGAVSFLSEHDEFRWTLFSRYAVPVGSTTITISLPQAASTEATTTSISSLVSYPDDRSVQLAIGTVAPGGGVSFAASWDKGVVHPPLRAFFLTGIALTYGVWALVVPVVLIGAILAWSAYRLHHKRRKQ